MWTHFNFISYSLRFWSLKAWTWYASRNLLIFWWLISWLSCLSNYSFINSRWLISWWGMRWWWIPTWCSSSFFNWFGNWRKQFFLLQRSLNFLHLWFISDFNRSVRIVYIPITMGNPAWILIYFPDEILPF